MHRLIYLPVAALAMPITACAVSESVQPTPQVTPAVEGESPTSRPALGVTPTMIPTIHAPVPLDAAPGDAAECVSIVGDSNSYGHIVYGRPDTGEFGVIRVRPLALPLEAHLDARGLADLDVIDRSLPAGGLVKAQPNYFESTQYEHVLADNCRIVVVMPFFPDIDGEPDAATDYIDALAVLVGRLTEGTPGGEILVLNYYQPNPETEVLRERLTSENIAAFNAALAEACAPSSALARHEQVICVDISGWFDDMDGDHLAGVTSREAFNAAVYEANRYSEMMDAYFAVYPDGEVIGDGEHLSVAGKDRLAARLAALIYEVVQNAS